MEFWNQFTYRFSSYPNWEAAHREQTVAAYIVAVAIIAWGWSQRKR